MLVDRKEAKRNIKQKQLVELQRQRKMDLSDDELLDNKELMKTGEAEESENDDDLEEAREIKRMAKE